MNKSVFEYVTWLLGTAGSAFLATAIVFPLNELHLYSGPEAPGLRIVSFGVVTLVSLVAFAYYNNFRGKRAQNAIRYQTIGAVFCVLILLIEKIAAPQLALSRLWDALFWISRESFYLILCGFLGAVVGTLWNLNPK